LRYLRILPNCDLFGPGVQKVSTEYRSDDFDGPLLVSLGQVRVAQGHHESLVPEQFLHRRQVDTAHDQVACENVAQVVETEVRDACFAAGGVERGADVVVGLAVTAREHQEILRASFKLT
jgi:hypothetical protein